jgi:HIRAN domain
VGQLSLDGQVYRFAYTKGSLKSPNFIPFGQMEALNVVYESKELFPLFANRLLSKTRPENKVFLNWLHIPNGEEDSLTLLGRSEGIRGTDSLMVFPRPEKSSDGTYHVFFFSHGLRYLPNYAVQAINELHSGSRLFLMPDPQNRHDRHAVALRTDDPLGFVGYCPCYLSKDFLVLLTSATPDTLLAKVERVNNGAPLQLRLLCGLRAPWPEGFEPCSEEEYEVLA